MIERDAKQDKGAERDPKEIDKGDGQSKLAGPRGSTAAAYETARQNQVKAEGITGDQDIDKQPDSRPGHTREAAENARTMNEGEQGDGGRKASADDQRDATDVQGYRRQDPEGKLFSR